GTSVCGGAPTALPSPPAPALTETIGPGPVSRFSLVASAPGGLRVGAPFTITVLAIDVLGDPVPSYNAAVAITLVSAPPGGTITGTLTGRFVNGVARFSGLSVTR